MKLALMRCCATAPVLHEYEAATDSLLSRFGIGTVALDFNCCGYPLRNVNFDAYVLSSARNLALADRAQLDLLTVCSCCYGSLKYVDQLLRRDGAVRVAANAGIAKERLHCTGRARVRHLLQVLHEDIGLKAISAGRQVSLEGLRVACHYGCHLLRPSSIAQLDDAASPSMLDEVIEATGATSVAWGAKLDCCGSPIWGVNDALSKDLTARKLASAKQAGADVVCVVCPYCHLQLDRVQRTLMRERGLEEIPIVLAHQLVGVAMGIAASDLGLAPERAAILAPRASPPKGASRARG